MYKVQEISILTEEGKTLKGYHLLKGSLPVFRANLFLDYVGATSINTAKQYSYRLCKFLNYLEERRNKNFKQATKKDVVKFIDSLIFENNNTLYISQGRITYNTASHYLTVIKEFYRFLEDELNVESNIKLEKIQKNNSKTSYLYGQIWDVNIKRFLSDRVTRTKATKEYTKWYTNEEKEAIKSNFNTIRDKAIFMLTLEGMRIDEVLSLRMQDYSSTDLEVSIYRSKGKETGNVGSIVAIPLETAKTIDDYIYNERDVVLMRLQEQSIWEVPDTLFLNLREGTYLGKTLTYRNYLRLLKQTANKAGLDPLMIRTHSGRSTKTMELLHHQVEHPEDNLTDEHIRQMMRWSNPNSIIPYINHHDKRLTIETAKKIQSRNKGDINESHQINDTD